MPATEMAVATALAFGLGGRDYAARIRSAGLEVVEDEFVNTLPQESREKYGLVKGEIIFKAIKP